jgi:hypothetical protein
MPDKLSPEVTIMLDKERHLKFGFRAMRAFEKETGKNLLKMKLDISEFNATELMIVLWACLLHEDKTLSLDDGIDILDKSDLVSLSTKMMEAINAAAPEKEEGDGDVPLAVTPQK